MPMRTSPLSKKVSLGAGGGGCPAKVLKAQRMMKQSQKQALDVVRVGIGPISRHPATTPCRLCWLRLQMLFMWHSVTEPGEICYKQSLSPQSVARPDGVVFESPDPLLAATEQAFVVRVSAADNPRDDLNALRSNLYD
jgi:hypothetical protein